MPQRHARCVVSATALSPRMPLNKLIEMNVEELRADGHVELVELADNPDEEVTSELGGLYINAADCCRKCKQQLAELQVAAPNTYRAAHTLLAFGVVAAEFRHRVHVYQDQGFFNEVLVENAEFVMAGRSIELAQYFDFFPGLSGSPSSRTRSTRCSTCSRGTKCRRGKRCRPPRTRRRRLGRRAWNRARGTVRRSRSRTRSPTAAGRRARADRTAGST